MVHQLVGLHHILILRWRCAQRGHELVSDEQKRQRVFKRRLLRKRLRPFLAVALGAFAPGCESVRVLMLEGVVSQLRDPRLVLQTASVKRLAGHLERFIRQRHPAINTLLELAVTEGTPKTTQALEGKNGILS